ncbi:NAD(P)-dependent nickel-iron dehydrogenase diaphorase component subunit HoxU [Geothermobacter ehrlichii]|uniref:NAD(P)-dependent nickel-iron dehydrogenase diaphorase component subunit HoxU n=1 Tax=Geothermobacter ehrlichii TaxID=213224 RepID=A0A5D3WJU6_9BACT|nr:bidirectional hydrogenase complex protein HoxU [Geothermobacter ehrlichii]TYO99245.1 NAD(P)-dependent nickel-iron dehydrogenase diaphorase component subunit HoxU [Geothermobacter ehrlichii]
MPVITLTINDELVSARSGQSLLEAIRDHGIDLPTLCHLDGLSARGGCRLCLVEVAGSPRLLPACTTEAVEGMVVTTHNERIDRYRRMILELTFAERNHTCAVCVSNGHCELQALAAELGMDRVRYDYLNPDLGLDTSHRLFGVDHNRCLLCLRCVRVCDEVEGAHTWDVAGRGIASRVITDLNRPWGQSESCTECGKCVEVCPTGALFDKGASVGEMEKESRFLRRILDGREKRQWRR